MPAAERAGMNTPLRLGALLALTCVALGPLLTACDIGGCDPRMNAVPGELAPVIATGATLTGTLVLEVPSVADAGSVGLYFASPDCTAGITATVTQPDGSLLSIGVPSTSDVLCGRPTQITNAATIEIFPQDLTCVGSTCTGTFRVSFDAAGFDGTEIEAGFVDTPFGACGGFRDDGTIVDWTLDAT